MLVAIVEKIPPKNFGQKVLIVDLNIFASFPTYAVGILVASLRAVGNEVDVLCPLDHGAPAVFREKREGMREHLMRQDYLSVWTPFRVARDTAHNIRNWWKSKPDSIVLRETEKALDKKPDIILLSAYLQHYETVVEIGKIAKKKGIPLLLGGPVFNIETTANAWREVPGLTAIFGGEADLFVANIVNTICDGGDLLVFNGITLPDGKKSKPAQPLRKLDKPSIPDYTDFPWDRYPTRIIPVMTGRGCQWNKCIFCSDVVSASGRTFRSRNIENVLLELQEQSIRHRTSNFIFLDLKLNSNPNMFRGIIENIRTYVPKAQWIGTVHVDLRKDNGLSPDTLKQAVASGMRRVSFGLETGSQTLLNKMKKGSSVEANSTFIRNAHKAGLSIRCTMISGFPGETYEDLKETSNFLEDHLEYLDRVRFNTLAIMEGTPIYDRVKENTLDYSGIKVTKFDHKNSRAEYVHPDLHNKAYRVEKKRVLRAVYAINRKKIRVSARDFDGLM